jgi:hypothetical protein
MKSRIYRKKQRSKKTKNVKNNKSRKNTLQKGGITNNDRQSMISLGFTDQDIQYILDNNNEIDITYFQNAVNSVPGNPFFLEPRSAHDIMNELREINEINPDEPASLNLEEDNTDSEWGSQSIGVGGKNRQTRTTRQIKNTRKNRKTRKTRMTRSRKQYGGNGFTTSADTMIEEDDKEYKEMNELAFPKKE